MITRIDTNKVKSLIKPKQELNIAQEFYDRLQIFNEDRYKRLKDQLYQYEIIDLSGYYDRNDKIFAQESIPGLNDTSMMSIEKYFDSLNKLARLVRQMERR